MNQVKNYLTLQGSYQNFMDLRWSIEDNCLEFGHGGTFAFAEEIAEFLEGFARVRRVVHFTFMVHLLLLLRQEPDKSETAHDARWRLRKLFIDSGGSLRNAGAFCGRLCCDIPAARGANQIESICLRLRARQPLYGFLGEQTHDAGTFVQIVAHGFDLPEVPPFGATRFQGMVMEIFHSCSDEEVIFWFKHGRSPVDGNAGAALAQAIPPTLSGRLASLLTRTRLTRARAWVAQLFGALSLPPRRLAYQDLPNGGYSDVTTRGQIDQILPSQFALDDWDFIRRFAERELLYFRREDPHVQTRQEMVVILDQGVRTWGDVRLVLGAALLALGRQALLRGYSFLLATTAMDRIDPLQVDEESLGEMVEASDLSAHPGLAIERVLEQPHKKDRDIVLLTHPRNLDEEEVCAAARRLGPGSRLFALTLDRHGQAELSEFKHGTPVVIRQFHVDYAAAPSEPATTPITETGKWTGDVEPIGYPFRFGVGGAIGATGFDFDFAENYLLTAGSHGVLHLWDVTGNLVEILPRTMWQGNVLHGRIPFVLGVVNGFVVADAYGSCTIAAHYDLEARKCTCHPLGGNIMAGWNLQYSPEHHCLVMPHLDGGLAIDLSTCERFATNLGGTKNRAQDAWIAWEQYQVPSRRMSVDSVDDQSRGTLVSVDPEIGTVRMMANYRHIPAHAAPMSVFTPLADGRPFLRKRLVQTAQLGGPNLALQTLPMDGSQDVHLHLIRTPEGVPLGEYLMSAKKRAFRLSANGTLLARLISDSKVEISQVAGSLTNLGRTKVGGFAYQLPFVLGEDRLLVFSGRHAFLLDWSSGKLAFSQPASERGLDLMPGIRARAEGVPEPCKYDTLRWLLGASGTLLAASDRYGQIAVFDRRHNLVCMFFAFRARLAGWMPDGTQFGPVGITWKPPGDEVAVHFGRALLAASRRGAS